MAKVEINVDDVTTDLNHMWKKKGEKDDKHKGKQGKPVRKTKQ